MAVFDAEAAANIYAAEVFLAAVGRGDDQTVANLLEPGLGLPTSGIAAAVATRLGLTPAEAADLGRRVSSDLDQERSAVYANGVVVAIEKVTLTVLWDGHHHTVQLGPPALGRLGRLRQHLPARRVTV